MRFVLEQGTGKTNQLTLLSEHLVDRRTVRKRVRVDPGAFEGF